MSPEFLESGDELVSGPGYHGPTGPMRAVISYLSGATLLRVV